MFLSLVSVCGSGSGQRSASSNDKFPWIWIWKKSTTYVFQTDWLSADKNCKPSSSFKSDGLCSFFFFFSLSLSSFHHVLIWFSVLVHDFS